MDYLLVAQSSEWLDPAWWWAVAQVIIGLGMVIFVHELGHFLVAKACGVKCEKFYVGFDAFDIKLGDRVIIPRSLLKYQWGETEYGIGVIPLGGYVKMLGQDDNPSNMEEEIRRSMKDPHSDEETSLPSGLIDRSKLDPRSYLAKSVPQRMAIISAGVIFNLIFAALFAAIAFRSGVNYQPPVVGNVIPGGPAWEQDLSGVAITKIGDKETSGYFTFMDIAQEVALNGVETPIPLEFKRSGDEQISTAEVMPRVAMRRRAADLPLIGVSPTTTSVIGKNPTTEGNPAEKADPALLENDRIVKVNDFDVTSGFTLRQALAQNFDKEIKVVLERPNGESENESVQRVTTTIGRNPMRELGVVMRWMPVASIQQGSPAANSDLQIGDVILEIDGRAPGSLLTLDQRMTVIARDNPRPVKFKVRRKTGSEPTDLEIEITPRLPRVITQVSENHPIGIDSLGVAIPSSKRVAEILPNSPAESADIQVGDLLVAFEFRLSEEQKKNPLYRPWVKKSKIDLAKDESTSWLELIDLAQQFEIGSKFGLTFQRNQKLNTVELVSTASDEFYLATRGIRLQMLQNGYQSNDFSEALYLGAQQTKRDASRVWKFLVKLVNGQISPTNLGGPGTIAMAATSEATQGTSRLLLFLTLLSANLAIINFLPIPILDGGHMLFLAYEGLFRRPVTPQVQNALMVAGFVFLICLMVFVLGMDAFRFSEMF